jgi:glycosyltransferase involved in cell wall biosynthesis
MKLGVVIPTLGENLDWLEQSLGSIRVASKDVKIVLVARSTDLSLEKLAIKYQAILVKENSAGVYPALNQGIRELSETCEFYMYL